MVVSQEERGYSGLDILLRFKGQRDVTRLTQTVSDCTRQFNRKPLSYVEKLVSKMLNKIWRLAVVQCGGMDGYRGKSVY